MMTIVLFAGTAIFFAFEGRLLLRLMTPNFLSRAEEWSLGFPLAAFVNVLLFFVLTLFGISFNFLIIFGFHALLIFALWKCGEKGGRTDSDATICWDECNRASLAKRLLVLILCLSILVKLFYGFTHAVLLPSLYYDSLSQWNHRAQVSYEDRSIAFDRDESRGVSKSQYPILVHSLQIAFMFPQSEWKDRVSNATTFAFTLTSLLGVFLFLARRKDPFFAILFSAAFLMIPLIGIHLEQGLGDIHVVTSLLLSALFLFEYIEKDDRRALLLSAFFCALSAWAKQEGLFFGIVPWIAVTALFVHQKGKDRKEFIQFGFAPLLLGCLWSAFLTVKGFPLGAHGGDFALQWHGDALPHLLQSLFSFGSFGVYWYTLPLLLLLFGRKSVHPEQKCVSGRFIILWGLLTFAETLLIFLATPNVTFLLNNQTFHRTALIALTLLLFGTLLLIDKKMRVGQIGLTFDGAK